MRRVLQGPSFQYRTGSEYKIPLNPTVSTKNVVELKSLMNSREKVGSGSGVIVGGNSGIREVEVTSSVPIAGVDVIGVAVASANRSLVGISVTVG